MPTAPSVEEDGHGTRVIPAVSFLVTVFPNAGVCIGSNYCHVIGDGKTFMHFIRTWTNVYKAGSGGGALTCLEKLSLPLLNRDVIKDPIGVESFLLEVYHNWLSSSGENTLPTDVGSTKVRATFVLCQADVERLKQMVKSQCTNETDSDQFNISTFVVTCSLIWVSLIKSKQSLIKNSSLEDDDELYYFLFPFDCRNRLEFPIPETYLGNCIKPGIAEMKKTELVGENGIVLAAKAIGGKVKETERIGLSGVENWMPDIVERSKTGRLIGVAGSPKLRVYDTEFGWGRPRKVEVVHIESGEAISLSECRDEEGGIEVGVALNSNQMDNFVAIFQQSLKIV